MVQPPKKKEVPSSGSSAEDTDHTAERTSSESMRSEALSSSSRGPLPIPKELDVMLPKVCEALVLVTQCIITVCLEAEEQQTRLEEGISTFVDFANMKEYYIQKKHDGYGVVESLIDLLSLLDIFLPRIQFGKPVNSDGTPLSSDKSPSADVSGFSYVKRDLVRLLGVLSHGAPAVQDRTREAGGLPVVMNMCVVDERNPYLREHAIFTLHNLLKNNPKNQGFVDSVKPSQEWDTDGTLKTRVGATLK
jgi:ataxin-10